MGMSKYENLRLREPEINPTKSVLEKVLGESYSAYNELQRLLGGLELEQVWQYYPCVGTKAWMTRGEYKWTTPRGTNKSKNIYWLSAWEGYFKVAVWFLEKNRAELLKAEISEETKRLVRNAKTFGKMMTFPVELDITSAALLPDLCALIKCKKRLET